MKSIVEHLEQQNKKLSKRIDVLEKRLKENGKLMTEIIQVMKVLIKLDKKNEKK